MSVCPTCKFSAMCLMVGFERFAMGVVKAHLEKDVIHIVSNGTDVTPLDELIQNKADEAIKYFGTHLPPGCPGRDPLAASEMEVFQNDFGALELDLQIALPRPLRRIGLTLKADGDVKK